jgi:hypothetical protein
MHRVFDVCKSDIVNNENVVQVSLEEIKSSLPENYVKTLERYNCDLPTYEHVQFLLENNRWGEHVILTTEDLPKQGVEIGKALIVISLNMFKVQQFERKVII